MKRNVDLCRRIMLETEEHEEPASWINLEIEGFSEEQVTHHVRLLYEAGLLEAQDLSTMGGIDWRPKRLTSLGHDFVEAARNDSRWEQAKETINIRSHPVTLDAIKAELVKIQHRLTVEGISMSLFDQRNQRVQYQYNAAGNINFGDVQNKADMGVEIEKLLEELKKAREAEAIDDDTAIDAEYQIKKAAQESRKPAGQKKGIIEYLESAKRIIEQVPNAVGIATGIQQAIQKVMAMF